MKFKKQINDKFLKMIFLYILFILYIQIYFKIKNKKKKKIGVISVYHAQNVGNILVKYSIFIKLKEYNFEPIIVCPINETPVDIDFLIKNNINNTIINKSFSELNEKDYDYLIVNSDQTWNIVQPKYLLDYGFLRFAENWTIPKFVYAASLGVEYWPYSKEFDNAAKRYLRNFTGISVREKGAVNLVEKHLGIKPFYTLDPTFLIDKKYYLDLIDNFKKDFDYSVKYLFVYQLDNNDFIKKFINDVSIELNYTIFKFNLFEKNFIENFLFGINISEAVITDSFHGTVFSIIFNKPFISFVNSNRGRLRFYSLNETFNLKNRIFFPNMQNMPSISILKKPLNINHSLLKNLKKFSIKYLEKNLNLI